MTNRIHLVAIMMVMLGFSYNAAAADLTVISHELKPFTWKENGTVKGLAYDMVTATMKKMNNQSEIKLLPFTRALTMVQNEPDIVLFHVQRTPEREHTMKWVGPIVTNGVYIYSLKKSKIKFNSLEDLRKLKYIAVVSGEATDSFLRERNFTNLLHVRQQSQSLEMLSNGKVEASPFGELVVGAYARGNNIDISLIEKTKIKLFESVLYMGFSKNVPDDVIWKWQKALDEVKKTQYTILYQKYILK
jgi:polar amino acid transport system substrate-binding protein